MFLAHTGCSSREKQQTLFNSIKLVGKLKGKYYNWFLLLSELQISVSYFLGLQKPHSAPKDKKEVEGGFKQGTVIFSPVLVTL